MAIFKEFNVYEMNQFSNLHFAILVCNRRHIK